LKQTGHIWFKCVTQMKEEPEKQRWIKKTTGKANTKWRMTWEWH